MQGEHAGMPLMKGPKQWLPEDSRCRGEREVLKKTRPFFVATLFFCLCADFSPPPPSCRGRLLQSKTF